jgi:ferric-dicitrate binding protein FerR (iron transport regulator)
MTSPRTTIDLESLQRSIRSLPRRTAHPEFRARLRAQFVQDAIPVRRRGAATTWRITAAAASIAVILALGWFLNRGPSWTLAAASGSGAVEIDGHSVQLDAPAEIARRLRPGGRVRLPADAQLDLELPGKAMIQLVGGSSVTLPGTTGRWIGRSMTATLDAGELRGTTGPAFRGVRLTVRTPETRAIVTGTTFAVLRLPDASCVCVLEGSVAMITAGATDTVRAGLRRSVFRSARPPLVEPILPMETMKLTMLRDQARQALDR